MRASMRWFRVLLAFAAATLLAAPVHKAAAQAVAWVAHGPGGSSVPDGLPGCGAAPYASKSAAVDAAGNVYVTGCSSSGTTNRFLTVKYDATGAVLWEKTWDNGVNAAAAYALAIDGSGNVYVTGQSASASGNIDYATVKYDTNGNGGTLNASSVRVVDTLQPELNGVSAHWQCAASDGASCTASGTGNLDQTISLPVGSSVVYLLTATVVGENTNGLVSNSVSVTNGADTITRTDDTTVVLFRDGFELGGDGSEPWPTGAQPIALGTLDDAHSLAFAVDAAQFGSLQRVTLAQAEGGAFRVEAIRIGEVVHVRLVARTAQGEAASEWSVLDGNRAALVLDGARLGLVGAKADLDLVLAHGGTFAVGGLSQ